jgi:hypothetical protein
LTNIRTIRIAFVAIVILTALIAGAVWQNRPIVWSQEKQITNGSGDSRLVDLSTDPSGKALHLVWEDNRDETMEVYYKHSLDDGATWGPDVRVSNLTPNTVEPEPRLAVLENTVLVFFSNATSTGEHLYYVASNNQGSRFSTPTQLTNDLGHQTNVAVAFVGSAVYVVWQGYFSNGEEHIFFVKSQNAGLTWEKEVALTNVTAQDRHPAVAAVGDKVFVTWSRYDQGLEATYVKSSLDGGVDWKPEVQVSDYEPSSFLEFPTIGSNGTHVHVVWNSNGTQYSRSSDSGATWTTSTPLTNATRQYIAPRISVVGSQIQLVIAAISTQGDPRHLKVESDVYYVRSSDGGERWTAPIPLNTANPGALALAPAIGGYGDASFIAWQDNRNGHFAVYFLSRPDFAVLRAFEWQLLAPSVIVLVAATVLYVGLESRAARAVRRRTVRKGRVRRRSKPLSQHETLMTLGVGDSRGYVSLSCGGSIMG